VAEFLLEVYVSRIAMETIESAVERARAAAEELTREGRPVELERTILVPEDETSFYLYEAASAEDVREAARRAALPFDALVGVADVKGERP
jgi:hypothetical protein